jgi:hypothetical protein
MYPRLKPDYVAGKTALSGLIVLPNGKEFKRQRQQSMSVLDVLNIGLSGPRAAGGGQRVRKALKAIRRTFSSFECLSCKGLSAGAALEKFRQEASKSRGFP